MSHAAHTSEVRNQPETGNGSNSVGSVLESRDTLHTHFSHHTAVDHIHALEYCIQQFKLAPEMSGKQLHDLACDFEHCNTAVVTWLASESIRKGKR